MMKILCPTMTIFGILLVGAGLWFQDLNRYAFWVVISGAALILGGYALSCYLEDQADLRLEEDE